MPSPRGADGRALPVQETREGRRRCTLGANLTYLCNRPVSGVVPTMREGIPDGASEDQLAVILRQLLMV
jgi:hypothetical protein